MDNSILNNSIYILLLNIFQFWNLDEAPYNISVLDYESTKTSKGKNQEEAKLTYKYMGKDFLIIKIKANLMTQRIIKYSVQFV